MTSSHVNKVASACFFHIRPLKQIRRLLGQEATSTLISTFVLSRLDYCNAVLAGLPKVTIAPLQWLLSAPSIGSRACYFASALLKTALVRLNGCHSSPYLYFPLWRTTTEPRRDMKKVICYNLFKQIIICLFEQITICSNKLQFV